MVGMKPLEFLEEVHRSYMVSTFGAVINYDNREQIMKMLCEMRSEGLFLDTRTHIIICRYY